MSKKSAINHKINCQHLSFYISDWQNVIFDFKEYLQSQFTSQCTAMSKAQTHTLTMYYACLAQLTHQDCQAASTRHPCISSEQFLEMTRTLYFSQVCWRQKSKCRKIFVFCLTITTCYSLSSLVFFRVAEIFENIGRICQICCKFFNIFILWLEGSWRIF